MLVLAWQVCFTGGVIEVRARMPSNDARVQPKIALMGNLASVANDASFAGVWPWSYDQCKKVRHLTNSFEPRASKVYP